MKMTSLVLIRGVLSACLCFYLAAAIAQSPFPVRIENPTAYPDQDIYVAIVGEDLSSVPGLHVWVDVKTGQQYPMNRSYNTMPGPIYGGNANPDGTALYADCFTKLSDIPNRTVPLSPIQGCRIFLSVGQPLYLFFHGASGAPSGYSGPSHTDPTDPSQGILYEIIELTYNQYGFFGNPTRVDSYKMPIGMELFGHDGYYKKVGEVASHEDIVAAFPLNVPQEFQLCLNSETGEIVAPSKTPEFADGSIGTMPTPGPYVDYMKPYIDAVWSKYAQEDLIFDSGDAGVWKGRVQGEQLVLTSQSPAFAGRQGIIVRRPTTQEAFEGKGVLDNVVQDATTDLLVQAQICAALNRHVIDTETPNVGLQNWSDESTYYQKAPCNYYAKFWHDRGISYNGLSYGFAYDDVWDYSPSVHTPSPSEMVITLGGYSNVSTPDLASISISPASSTIELNSTVQLSAAGFDAGGNAVSISPSWSSSGGSISSSGLFTANTVGTFSISATDRGIVGNASITVIEGGNNNTNCTGQAHNQDYTYEAQFVDGNTTLTFIPGYAGVGDNVVILYYSKQASGGYPGYIVQPNVPFTLNASEGETVHFYYTYSVPEGGERNTYDHRHEWTVASCNGNPSTDTEAPSSPSNLVVSNLNASGFSLSWDASSDNIGVTGYSYQLNGGAAQSTTSTTLSFSNLLADTDYLVSVVAKDAAGNSSAPATITVRTNQDSNNGATCSGSHGHTNAGVIDYSYSVVYDNQIPSITFTPERAGVASSTIIIILNGAGHYMSADGTGSYTFTANGSGAISFYFVYNVPEGGERNNAQNPHTCQANGNLRLATPNTLADKGSLHTYPNPAKGYLQFKTPADLQHSHATIRMINIGTGQVINLGATNIEGQHTLDISNYASGMYLLELIHSKGIYRSKWIKQ